MARILPGTEGTMKRSLVFLTMALFVAIAAATAQQKEPTIEVYKNPT
jgi:hypothetical protein